MSIIEKLMQMWALPSLPFLDFLLSVFQTWEQENKLNH